jgi:hypothetical protein
MHDPAHHAATLCGKPHHLSNGRWRCLCPAHADRNPSLVVADGYDALLVHCFAGCDRRDVLDALREIGVDTGSADHGDRVRAPRKPAPRVDDAEIANRIAMAGRIWQEAIDPHATLAEKYLQLRGLDLLVGADVVRFHPSCPRGPGADGARGQRQAAMICLMRDLVSDKPVAIHRRYLRSDGTKDGKPYTLGRVPGSAIKLTLHRDTFAEELSCCSKLHIAEGFETALGALMLGHAPIWALGAAGELARFPVLFGVGELVVLTDHDFNDVGLHAAHDAIERWHGAGKRARGIWPRMTGFDFADVVEAQR